MRTNYNPDKSVKHSIAAVTYFLLISASILFFLCSCRAKREVVTVNFKDSVKVSIPVKTPEITSISVFKESTLLNLTEDSVLTRETENIKTTISRDRNNFIIKTTVKPKTIQFDTVIHFDTSFSIKAKGTFTEKQEGGFIRFLKRPIYAVLSMIAAILILLIINKIIK